MQPEIQSSFAAGELSPALYGHVDFAKFAIGASTLRNFFVSYKGGAYSRAGFRFIGYSKMVESQQATGDIVWVLNPTNGSTVTLNGIVWTFVAGAAGPHQTHIQGTLSFTLANLALDLNNATDPELTVATYSQPTNDTLTITYDAGGAIGNAYTLAASEATVSGPTLTGGTSAGPRLIPFQFSINQGRILEFGARYMRVISGGAFVSDLSLTVLGISTAATAVVQVGSTAGLTTGQWVQIDQVLGMLEVNGSQYVIAVLDATHFSLHDVYGNDVSSLTWGAYTSGGLASRIYEITTPYEADDLKYLKFTQSADVMSLTCRNQETGTEYAPQELSRFADDNWTITPLNTLASIDPPTGGSGYPTNSGVSTTGLTGLTDFQYVVTAIDRDTGEESVASDIIDVPNSVNIALTAGAINLSWDGVNGARYYNVYKAPPAFRSTVPIGSLFGYAGSTYGSAFVDGNIVADMTQVPPLHKNPFAPGACIGVDFLTPGSGITTLDFTINTATGSGAEGYGIVVSGETQGFVFTNGGQDYAETDTITFTESGGASASGTLTFSAQPAVGSTLTLNGIVWTFVAGAAGPYQTKIQGTLSFTLANLAVDLSASTDASLTVASYVQTTNTTVVITYNTPGTTGNAYTTVASGASNCTPTGATLAGGVGGTPPTGTLIVGPESGTYPSVVAYFQQRRFYGNTANEPDTYFGSQPGSFSNFDSRIPTIDTDAIVGTPWAQQVDGIQFMIPMIGGLLVLTGQAAYQVGGAGTSPSNPQPITPSSQQAVPQAYNGCNAHVAPVTIDYDVYYLQSKGSVIRSLSYNFWVNVLTGVDVTYLSSHLFNYLQIEAMAWCEEPFKLMWCVRGDGVLLSLTSMKTQEVMGWARHDTNGAFISAASISELPNDILYVATQRFMPDGTTPFMIERQNERFWNSIEDCWCVDAGLSLPPTYPQAQLTVSSAAGLGQPVDVEDLVGGSNYQPNVQVTVIDQAKVGTGCVVTATVVGGVITALSFSGGTGYLAPLLVFTDPSGGGGGASGTVVLDNSSTFTSSASVFDAGMVGWVVRVGAGIGQISAYTSGTEVTCQIVAPLTGIIPNSGGMLAPIQYPQWTITEPVETIYGLRHLIGLEVTGLADGNVITPRTVTANGTIVLDGPASAVIVGLGFETQLQSLYLAGGNPTEQGRRKHIPAVTVRVEGSGSFEVGSNQPDAAASVPPVIVREWSNMVDATINIAGLSAPFYGSAVIQDTDIVRPAQLYTGDVRAIIAGGFEKPGQVAVQQTLPLPLNVLAFIREVEMGDLPESDSRQRDGG